MHRGQAGRDANADHAGEPQECTPRGTVAITYAVVGVAAKDGVGGGDGADAADDADVATELLELVVQRPPSCALHGAIYLRYC